MIAWAAAHLIGLCCVCAAAVPDLETGLGRYQALARYAWVPLDEGALDAATRAADELITEGQDPDSSLQRGDTLHHGYLIRGRVALRREDLAKARASLREAGRVPSSTMLETYGPNTTLAREMLDRGESAVVLQFLRECEGLWTGPRSQIARWVDQLSHGETPDLTSNLSY